MQSDLQKVFQILNWEVIYQREHWTKPEDDKLTLSEWEERLDKHLTLAKEALSNGDDRTFLFEVTVLAGTAVGCLDSNTPPLRGQILIP